MVTQLIRILVSQCLGLIAIAVVLNQAVASQAASLERSSISQRKEIQPNIAQGQPRSKVYLNSLSGIHIISDRQESVVEFFQHRRIVVGTVLLKDWNKTLKASQESQRGGFLSYPSFNDDRSGKTTTYGLIFRLSPVSSDIVQLWEKRRQLDDGSVPIFLERDPKDSKLYHFVGWADAGRLSFFSVDSQPTSLNPQKLWYRGEKYSLRSPIA
jgi:hypothetical protein